MSDPIENYKKSFAGSGYSEPKIHRALSLALDVRRFEIELYWKRATYFWVFTGAALAAYLAALTGKGVENRPEALLLTSSIGLVFSVAWYFVNRASKYWQSNWEAHVDLLEDDVNGPAYKTVLTGTPWWKPHGPYPFSVSKINQMLSLFVVAIFTLLVVKTLYAYYELSKQWVLFPTACVSITLAWIALLILLGRTGPPQSKVSMRVRKTTLEKYYRDDG